VNAFLLVAAGGALGAVTRYGASLAIARVVATSFPLATLVVNILGSVLMGVLVGALARWQPEWQHEARLFIAVGILGGFTTFSSFSLDTVALIERGALAQAGTYAALSVVVCLLGLYLGLLITRGSPA
jgi:CrcB protein